MITATNATKRFEDITAVDHICAEVKGRLGLRPDRLEPARGKVHVSAHAGRHFAAG